MTIAATGTVSTGPSVCPVSHGDQDVLAVQRRSQRLDGRTVSGMNSVAPELPEPLEPAAPADPEEPEDPADPESADPAEEPAEPEPPPMSTTAPAGATVVAVPRSATVPVAWMPVTSS